MHHKLLHNEAVQQLERHRARSAVADIPPDFVHTYSRQRKTVQRSLSPTRAQHKDDPYAPVGRVPPPPPPSRRKHRPTRLPPVTPHTFTPPPREAQIEDFPRPPSPLRKAKCSPGGRSPWIPTHIGCTPPVSNSEAEAVSAAPVPTLTVAPTKFASRRSLRNSETSEALGAWLTPSTRATGATDRRLAMITPYTTGYMMMKGLDPTKNNLSVDDANELWARIEAELLPKNAVEVEAEVVLARGVALRQKELRSVMDACNLTHDQIVHLAKEFSNAATGKVISRPQFSRTIGKQFHLPDAGIQKLFSLFDIDHSGSIDFVEFVRVMGTLIAGSHEAKIKFLFDLYDMEGKGSLNVRDVVVFARETSADMFANVSFAEKIISTLDADKNHSVDFQEFLQASKEMPSLMKCFASVLPQFPLEDKQEVGALDWKCLQDIWKELRAKDISGKISFSVFNGIFEKIFNLPSDGGTARKMFEMLDREGTGEIDFRELMLGLSSLHATSEEERLKFFFQLVDVDGNGHIDRAELDHLLRQLKRRTLESRLTVDTVMNVLDSDGDGTISLEEFVSGVGNDPTIRSLVANYV